MTSLEAEVLAKKAMLKSWQTRPPPSLTTVNLIPAYKVLNREKLLSPAEKALATLELLYVPGEKKRVDL